MFPRIVILNNEKASDFEIESSIESLGICKRIFFTFD